MTTPTDTAGLIRRVRFAESCRYHLDIARNAVGLRRRSDSFQWFYYALTVGFDAVESVRAGGRVGHPGRPQHAALLAPIRLEQNPRYRAYWYEPASHTLVGVLLGLDLHRHQDRYYLLESNLTAGLMRERRALYDTEIDPFLAELTSAAGSRGFERIVLYRRSWTREHLREFTEVTRSTGMPVVPATAMKHPGNPVVNPMTGLPEDLAPRTVYVVCTAVSDSPIFAFLHNKKVVARWFAEAVAEARPPPAWMAAVPTYDEPRLPDGPLDPRWPNMVIKLANSDKGQDVLMGRFDSLEQVRQVLGLSADGTGLPKQFRNRLHRSWTARLLPQALSAIYQPFVPPEVVDGYPRLIRMETFVSPIFDTYLSSHGTVGGEKVPESAPLGVLMKESPYNVSVPPGRFVRLDRQIEDELRAAAREFGEIAGRAIRKKFEVSPSGDTAPRRPPAHGPARPAGAENG